MLKKTSVWVVLALALFTAACPKRTSIADVNARPSKYSGKTVAVAGVVKESYGLSIPGTQLGGGLYKIDDGTGSLWVVVSDGNVPQRGAEVGVQGRVTTGVTWNGRNYGLGMHEERRRSK
jgi:hypothetical protein